MLHKNTNVNIKYTVTVYYFIIPFFSHKKTRTGAGGQSIMRSIGIPTSGL